VAGPARAFKEARWLSGVKPLIHNQAQIKGTVEEVGGQYYSTYKGTSALF